jgi:hypothetical protein
LDPNPELLRASSVVRKCHVWDGATFLGDKVIVILDPLIAACYAFHEALYMTDVSTTFRRSCIR